MQENITFNSLFWGAGAFFPLFSFMTGLWSAYEWKIKERHCSPVFIPFIGPILLDIGLLLVQAPRWTLLLPWALDIGTLAFLIATPGLIKGSWQRSVFARIETLTASQENQISTITLHKTGKYLLRKKWQRPAGELGVNVLGELGHFVRDETGFSLYSDTGCFRSLKYQQNKLVVLEERNPVHPDYSLQGWTFQSPRDQKKQAARI